MKKTSGRPKGTSNETKQDIIQATIALIKKHGGADLTIRQVCQEANIAIGTFYHHFKDKNDLLTYFIKDGIFPTESHLDEVNKGTTLSDKLILLYTPLANAYQNLGRDFMTGYYRIDNSTLSSFLSEKQGQFPEGTVMAISEEILLQAQENKQLLPTINCHQLADDLCTLFKGCIFEWFLSQEQTDLHQNIQRIFSQYLAGAQANDK